MRRKRKEKKKKVKRSSQVAAVRGCRRHSTYIIENKRTIAEDNPVYPAGLALFILIAFQLQLKIRIDKKEKKRLKKSGIKFRIGIAFGQHTTAITMFILVLYSYIQDRRYYRHWSLSFDFKYDILDPISLPDDFEHRWPR